MALTGGPSPSQRLFTSTPFSSASTSVSPSLTSNSPSKPRAARNKPPDPVKREQPALVKAEHDDEGRAASVTSDGGSVDESGRSSKKKKANRACAACQKAHLTCDDARPCTRCAKKGMGFQCTDGKRKRAKYLLDEDELEVVKAREQAEKEQKDSATATTTPSGRRGSQRTSGVVTPASIPPPFVDNSSELKAHVRFPVACGPQAYGPGDMFPPSNDPAILGGSTSQETPPLAFESEATSLEYSILSAMLNGIDPSLLSGSPDQFGNAFSNGQSLAITPRPSNTIDLTDFFDNSGTNLPSVGMAADQSSHWLLDGSQFPPAQPQDGASWASTSTSAEPFGKVVTMASLNLNGQQPQLTGPVGQLHAIGGNDTIAAPGEVGAGGFKALEVPSPSSSLASTQRLGLEDGFSSSTPPEIPGHGGAKTGGPTSQQAHPSSSRYAVSTTVPDRGSSGNYNRPGVQLMEAQWRERVNQIYASIAIPFPYPQGYHFLLKFATDNFEKAEVLRIVRALGLFRPSLIALQMPLTEEDEIFVERSIQRTILEFEKLISFSGTPTVVWRRTCEICVVGSEFSMLTGWSRETLLGRRVYEFWDKESTLEYWEKFASHAFENTSQSIVANVVLKKPDGSSVPCAACFSIKRNVFDLPSLIVGAFLPILSSSSSTTTT